MTATRYIRELRRLLDVEPTPPGGWTAPIWNPDTAQFEFRPPTPITSVGDMIFGDTLGVAARLPGNTSTTLNILTQTGFGTVSAPPVWQTPDAAGLVDRTTTQAISGTKNFSSISYTTLTNVRWIVEGDSISDPANDSWPVQLPLLSPEFATATFINVAISADTINAMIGEYATQVAPHKPTRPGEKVYLFIFAGTNDGPFMGHTPAQVYADLKTYWAMARADGFIVVAFTLLPSRFLDGGWNIREINNPQVNALIRSDPSLYDYLVEGDLVLPDPTNIADYYDLLHPTHAGAIKLARAVMETITRSGQVNSSNNLPFRVARSPLVIGGDTLNPNARLQVGYHDVATGVVQAGRAAPAALTTALSLSNLNAAVNNNAVGIDFHPAIGYSPTARIRSVLINATTAQTDVVVDTYASGGALGESLRVVSDGSLQTTLRTPSAVGYRINCAFGQSGNALEINSSGGSGGNLTRVDATGQLTTASHVIAGGQVASGGVNAGLFFQERSTVTQWGLYAQSGAARIYNGVSDVLTVSSTGNVAATGNITTPGVISAGTNTPIAGVKLHVEATNPYIGINSSTAGRQSNILWYNAGTLNWLQGHHYNNANDGHMFFLRNAGSGNMLLVPDGNGRVLVGTNVDQGADYQFQVRKDNPAGPARISIYNAVNGTGAQTDLTLFNNPADTGQLSLTSTSTTSYGTKSQRCLTVYNSGPGGVVLMADNPAGSIRFAAGGNAGQWTMSTDGSFSGNGPVTFGGNVAHGGAGSFGAGTGVTFLANATLTPSSNPTGGGILYAEAGSLKYRGSSGTVTTLAAA